MPTSEALFLLQLEIQPTTQELIFCTYCTEMFDDDWDKSEYSNKLNNFTHKYERALNLTIEVILILQYSGLYTTDRVPNSCKCNDN